MDRKLIIIPCGGKKALGSMPAVRLYIGPYFKSTARYALSKAVLDDIRILSAKHGLLKLTDVIAPYNLRMGMDGCVNAELVRQQATEQNLLDIEHVEIAAGKDYANVALEVWPHALWILDGAGGIGKQMQLLGQLAKGSKNGIPIN